MSSGASSKGRGHAIRWPGWKHISARKPLAVAAFIWAMGLCTVVFFKGRDFPPNVTEIVKWVSVTVIGGYCGTSAWEAVHKERDKQDE
ncbi:hypothetical protein FACS1894187_04920 [Synergistales bacterium]|nr:hypothetical protein FACS1894187_04920 [Synergistales bacterium]